MKANKNYVKTVEKYNLRANLMRVQDFRQTINEIVDINNHGKTARDFKVGDPSDYGKKAEKNHRSPSNVE